MCVVESLAFEMREAWYATWRESWQFPISVAIVSTISLKGCYHDN